MVDRRLKYQGCIQGLAAGDSIGAQYEGGPIERFIWWMIGTTDSKEMRWTDDTQMTVDIANSILEHGKLEQTELALQFSRSYKWTRGYGPGAARILKKIKNGEDWRQASKSVYPKGSFGNGAAMRSTVLALFYPESRKEVKEAARRSAEITHCHPIGIDGARIMAIAAQELLRDSSFEQLLETLIQESETDELESGLRKTSIAIENAELSDPKKIIKELGNGMTAPTSIPLSLYIYCQYSKKTFSELISFTQDCGGDVDTIGAMAGSLWGLINGPPVIKGKRIEKWAELQQLADKIYEII